MLEGYSVPIKIDVSNSELATGTGMLGVEGLLSYNEKQLTLDYQPFDRRMQKLQQDTALIPLREIGGIGFKKGLFGGRIVLRPMRMSVLAEVPGRRNTELILKVKRRDQVQAKALVSRVRLELSEARLDSD